MAITNKAQAIQQAQNPVDPETWEVCHSCGMERRVIEGRMVAHRRYSEQLQAMEACPGPRATVPTVFLEGPS